MMALDQAGYPTQMVEGSPWNIKITRPGDLQLAEQYRSLI
jgi:2-C-methyl-D-erythritol 4-phosphate cytidylyltransferase